MKSWPAAFLALLTLLMVAQRHARAEGGGMGWLIYSNPSMDRHYGQIMGQARNIESVRVGRDSRSNSSVLIVTDQGGNEVAITTSSYASQQALINGLALGKSLDISGCRHAARFVDSERTSNGCTANTYAAVFYCTPSDTRTLLNNWYYNPFKHHIANSRELTLYVTERECN